MRLAAGQDWRQSHTTEAEHIEAGVKHIEGGGAYVLDVATLVSSVGRCGGGVAAEPGGGEHSAAEAEHVDEGAL